VLGKAHPDTRASTDNLTFMLRRQGKYEAAEAITRQALERKKKTLGREHPITPGSVP